MKKIPSSEITPEHIYHSRRKFMKEALIWGMSATLLASCGSVSPSTAQLATDEQEDLPGGNTTTPQNIISTPADDPLTSYENATNYNNFYEFTTDKQRVATLAEDFSTNPWNIEISGLVHKPVTLGLEDLYRYEQEERVYRLRCVETWSMVIPWLGFPLSRLLKEVEPTSDAAYVKMTTLMDPEQMPGLNNFYPYPYVEGLRLDEAMHDLTILATGMYGKMLPPQNGAPIRLVVPWKYGFKCIKSIVKIELVKEMPTSFWMDIAPDEYGFYANVNPVVPHPRWSQAREKRIGETEWRETLLFNGYAEEVSYLYEGMDLSVRF